MDLLCYSYSSRGLTVLSLFLHLLAFLKVAVTAFFFLSLFMEGLGSHSIWPVFFFFPLLITNKQGTHWRSFHQEGLYIGLLGFKPS